MILTPSASLVSSTIACSYLKIKLASQKNRRWETPSPLHPNFDSLSYPNVGVSLIVVPQNDCKGCKDAQGRLVLRFYAIEKNPWGREGLWQ